MSDTDFSGFVPNVHFEQIPIKHLVSNQEYQRSLSIGHIEKAVQNFDLYQINPVKVSRRNGINYVFNGQHTIEIVAAVSGSRDTPVWCMIYDDLNYETEADIFANQQKYVKKLLPYEIFKANIEAGSRKQMLIKSLVESFGLQIQGNANPRSICCISTLEKIYDQHNLEVLERALRLCIGTWEGEPHSLSANMISGVTKLIVAYGDALNDEVFKEKVGRASVKDIIRTAKDRKAGSAGYAEAMLIAYNKKSSRNALRWSELYKNRKHIPDDMLTEEDMEEESQEDENARQEA